jgi:ribosomal protein S18 acetylase RimI-like enzyme
VPERLRIRRARAADAAALALAGAATFLETFADVLDGADIVLHCEREHSVARYAGWLRSPTARTWIAETPERGATVGYLVGERADLPLADLAPSDYEVKRIYLLSRFQGGGVGRALMERALADAAAAGASRLLLGVYAGNARAIGFYERLGFVACGARKFRVGRHECDDLIMARPVATPPPP